MSSALCVFISPYLGGLPGGGSERGMDASLAAVLVAERSFLRSQKPVLALPAFTLLSRAKQRPLAFGKQARISSFPWSLSRRILFFFCPFFLRHKFGLPSLNSERSFNGGPKRRLLAADALREH